MRSMEYQHPLRPPLLDRGRRDGEGALDLAAVETVVELHVVPAADPKITGHVVMQMMARKVHAAHVRAVRKDAGNART